MKKSIIITFINKSFEHLRNAHAKLKLRYNKVLLRFYKHNCLLDGYFTCTPFVKKGYKRLA